MKVRSRGGSLIRSISGAVYKTSHKLSEFVAQLIGVRNDSWGLVVFEKGMVREMAI